MDGTVTVLDVKVGERTSAGQAAVVLSDLATFVVEVNLDEVDVAKVSVGQEAVVTLDAFPDEELTGEVTDIAPVASVQSGVVLYPVTVRLSPADPSATDLGAASGQGVPARVGMTANVEIVIASKADALIVPLRAIQSDGGKSYVWRQSSDGFEKVEVTLGVMSEIEVEITGGLSDGDVVSVVASPAQGGGQPGWGPGGMFGGGE
jgi:HlyD family secretion protein